MNLKQNGLDSRDYIRWIEITISSLFRVFILSISVASTFPTTAEVNSEIDLEL